MTIIRGYEDLKKQLEEKQELPHQTPTPKFWDGLKPSSPSPSPLLSWYQHNYQLRSQGKLNELDIADITQALKGTKNKWFKFCEKEKKAAEDFLAYLEGTNKDLTMANILWIEIKDKKKDVDQGV